MSGDQLGFDFTVPLARATDPGTSHESEDDLTVEELRGLRAWVWEIVRLHPDETASELAQRYPHRDSRRIGRRLSDLLAVDWISVSGERPCRVTGRKAMTYRANACPTNLDRPTSRRGRKALEG